jgi:hypothetical protein
MKQDPLEFIRPMGFSPTKEQVKMREKRLAEAAKRNGMPWRLRKENFVQKRSVEDAGRSA